MKSIVWITALLVLTTACSGNNPDTPRQVVMDFFSAYENADGHTLVNCMSEGALQNVNLYMEQLRETPDESSDYLVSIGIDLSPEELSTITAGDFVSALLNSDSYADQLPDFTGTEFGTARIYGNKALVPVTTNGNMEEIELVLEDDGWKITDEGTGIL